LKSFSDAEDLGIGFKGIYLSMTYC